MALEQQGRTSRGYSCVLGGPHYTPRPNARLSTLTSEALVRTTFVSFEADAVKLRVLKSAILSGLGRRV